MTNQDVSVFAYAYGEVPEQECFNGLSYGRRKEADVGDACKLMIGKKIVGVQLCNSEQGKIGTDAFMIYLEDENGRRWELTIEGAEDEKLNFPELFTSIAELNNNDEFEKMED